MNTVFADLQEIFRDIFDDPSLAIQYKTCSQDIEEWDSLIQMDLLTAIEEHFKIHLQISEVIGLKNVGEMEALIRKKLGGGKSDV